MADLTLFGAIAGAVGAGLGVLAVKTGSKLAALGAAIALALAAYLVTTS